MMIQLKHIRQNIANIRILRDVYNSYREGAIYRRYYNTTKGLETYHIGPIACVDGHIKHGGLADRILGILTMYALFKIHNMDFKLYYCHPFDLAEFLVPNIHNWSVEKNAVCYSKDVSYPIVELGNNKAYKNSRLFKRLLNNKYKQIHLYSNMKTLNAVNGYYGTSYSYKELYHELFKPSINLQHILSESLQHLPEKYNSLCFRFRNTFGDIKEANFKPLGDNEKQEILDDAHKQILEILEIYKLPVLVTSDSHFFRESLIDMPNVFSVYKGLGCVHMDYSSDAMINVYAQSFIDYYALAKGENIFNITGKGRYISGFISLAGAVAGKPRLFYPKFTNNY